jgi:PAS domain-containing protein
LTVTCRDGTTRKGLFSGDIIESQGKKYCLTVMTDQTERKRAEEKLRREHAFLDAVIANIAEGLCVCHETAAYPYTRFTVWNDRMTEITGYTREEINRLGWYQSLCPDLEQ